ncbi:tyrosine-protein phosphatase [Streptomyces sp. SCSIO ZS0520]|uniref:tyrosine-protein phosphatase n=1 Tax=Streptomyces sp. SCSIO ZS0520 TaxID=2892996 RepID=UPI0021D9E0B0|nr:tyrosine-protein phosphatase [Streptomyces sp. SCSIO ZS0520]
MRLPRLLPAAPAAAASLCLLALSSPATAAEPAAASAGSAATAAETPGLRGVRGGHIPLAGTVNTRDLGGLGTVSGRHIREGLLFRSDSLGKLTDEGVEQLAGLGLRSVVDFRTPFEIEYDKPDRLPPGVTGTARPVSDNGSYKLLMDAIASRDPQKQQELLGDGKAEAAMHDIYRTFVTDPDSRAAFGATLRDLARGDSGPVLFHCTSGKDRTGWMTYVLLRALGASKATAEKDYLYSNTLRAETDKKARDYLKESGAMQNPDLIIPLQEVRTAYLDTALAEITRGYGSFPVYLAKGLGLDPAAQARLRARLLN